MFPPDQLELPASSTIGQSGLDDSDERAAWTPAIAAFLDEECARRSTMR
jgi:hypothetical protein